VEFEPNSGWLWLVPALAVGAVDWWSVAADRPIWEEKAKPLVMVALIGGCVWVGVEPSWLTAWIVGGLVFGLIGDVLLLPRIDNFIGGLAAFLIGHMSFLVGLLVAYPPSATLWIGVAIGVVLMVGMGRRVLGGVKGSSLVVPVAAYMAAVSALVVVGWGTGQWLVGIGATLFAASDGLLGVDRFVTGRHDRRVVVHILYHLGQILIVAGVVAL